MIQQDDEEEKGSFGATRYPCMPSLVAMQQMKNRLNLAFLGKKLMKWSAMATGRELRKISSEMHGVYGDFHQDSCNGYILLARARYFLPHLNSIVLENVSRHAQVSLTSSSRTISGVRVVQYHIEDTGKDPYEHLGIERGGQVIKEAKRVWNELIKRMIMILELRTSFILVEQANKSATKKSNVLGKMIIPKIIMTLKYILAELEENEREENFRLKRFKQLKIKRKSEEVVVCRCCFSNFAAGEVTGGDMCPLCKQNVYMKAKVDKTAKKVRCVKETELLDRTCHLDSDKMHIPYEDDGDTIQWQSDTNKKLENVEDIVLWLSIEDKIIDEDYNVTQLQSGEDKLEDFIEKDELKDILECPKCAIFENGAQKDFFKNFKIDFVQKIEPNEVFEHSKHDLSMCSGSQKTRMYSYILSVLSSVYDEYQEIIASHTNPYIRKLLRMPAYLSYQGVDIEKTQVPKLLRMPKNIIPVYIDNCKNLAPQKKIPKKLRMPLDLPPIYVPCEECKLSLLDTKPIETPCDMENCETCRPKIHMPLDLPILSCNRCSSKPHILMPLNLPIHISPCRSVCRKCLNKNADLSSVISDLYKPEPNSSLPYEVPRETFVCHSWSFKRLLRMPRSLSSGTSHKQSSSDPPKTSRCSCTPNMHSMIPENHPLNMYIHQLCQLQPNREHVRMPSNLVTESQPDLNSCEACITKEASTCSRSLTDDTHIITTSDENKLFEDCAFHGPGCCDSTCSLGLDDPDFEKIVKVETKTKRKPDGTFREEKVTIERYVVKTVVKPPDICSCSRLGLGVLGEYSKSYGYNEEGDAGKADTHLGAESESKQDYHNFSSKNRKDEKDIDSNVNKIKSQVICRCNDKEAVTSCECFKVATSESNDSENVGVEKKIIGNSKRLPDLVCCKNNACLTQNLMDLLTSYQLANKNLAEDGSTTKPCHSIVIKSADNETTICSGANSKEKSIRNNLNISCSQKEVEIVPPHCRFFKLRDTKSGTNSSCPISSIGTEVNSCLSPKWCNPSSSIKSIAQLNHSSTISKIVKTYLDKNIHKSTSCTDLLIVKQCLERSREVTKPLKVSNICNEKRQCPVKNCPFHSSKQEICVMSSDIKSQKTCAQNESQNVPTTSKSDKQAQDTSTNTDINLSIHDTRLKIKEEVIRVTRATSTDQNLYAKQEKQAGSQKSCCPIPSILGLPSTARPSQVTPKSSLSQYPNKYNTEDSAKKDAETQMKVPICDKIVEPCNAAIEKSASVSSRSSSKHKRVSSKKKNDKCVIKIKVKNKNMKPMTENKDFCIEGQMADGSNVVILRRSKSTLSKSSKQDEFEDKICKNCLTKLRGDKPVNRPNCHKNHGQQAKKCKYCDLLANYSVSADSSMNSIAQRSDNHCCQTSNTSNKSSTSISTPGDELYIKVSSSNPSTKTHPIPVSGKTSGVCEKASKLRGYASECAFHKQLKPCGRPRTCTSCCKVQSKANDAGTCTKNLNRYDVRSICDEPKSRCKKKCIPKASNVRCRSISVQCHLIKSDTALNKRRLRTRPQTSTSFYESDCRYFKPPCGCPY